MNNRVQLSLIFEDTDVYENLILPAKKGRFLSELVIKLVLSYYYNDDVRRIVDGDIEQEDSEFEERRNNLFTSINETLATLDFLSEEGHNITEGGTDLVSDILAGAEKHGMAEHVETDFGGGYTKVNIEKRPLEIADKEAEKHTNIVEENSRVDKLEEKVLSMEGMLLHVQEMLQAMSGANSGSSSSTEKSNVSVGSSAVPVEEKVAPVASLDATEDMNSLLSSLGI